MPDAHLPLLSRRAVLLGGAGTLALAACGGSGTAAGGTTTTAKVDPNGRALVQYFANDALRSGIQQRATFGVADAKGILTAGAPPSIELTITNNGTVVAGPTTVGKHDHGLPRPYYPIVFTPEQPGIYDATAKVGSVTTEAAAFQVLAPDGVTSPQVGEPMRPFDTPTVDDARGVDPICTADPPCPLHDVTLTAALAEGRPVAFLVSTPKYCQVAICGPVLDLLLAAKDRYPQVHMLHAEVWPNADQVLKQSTPVCQAYGLTFEPALFLGRADGTVFARLDTVYDAAELDDALRSLTA